MTEVFATSMPGAVEVGAGGSDPRMTVEGPFNGFAWRMLVAEADEAAIEAWYESALESGGWVPTDYGYISMIDGRSTKQAWRRDDLVLGLGFPDRDRLRATYPAGTLFAITITHEPEDD